MTSPKGFKARRTTHRVGSGRSSGFPAGSGKQVQRGRWKQEASEPRHEKPRGEWSEQWRPFWNCEEGVIKSKKRKSKRGKSEGLSARKMGCFPRRSCVASIRERQDRPISLISSDLVGILRHANAFAETDTDSLGLCANLSMPCCTN